MGILIGGLKKFQERYGIPQNKIKITPDLYPRQGFYGAAEQSRTADLILTKDALYLLSYGGIQPLNNSIGAARCQYKSLI